MEHRSALTTTKGLDATVTDFERASGPWHLEWIAIPEAFVLCSGALHQTNFALRGLVVNVSVMRNNLDLTKGLIVGEAVMMVLAPFLGRQKAHDVVYEACRVRSLEEQKLFSLCDPLNYLGSSQQMADRVLSQVK